jgi:hypothetical protein
LEQPFTGNIIGSDDDQVNVICHHGDGEQVPVAKGGRPLAFGEEHLGLRVR